ncbi:ABC transporter substrate-binding protein [Acinetobacter baumannii]
MKKFTRHLLVTTIAAATFSTAFSAFAAEAKPTVIRIGVPSAGVGGKPVTGGNYVTSTAAQRGILEKEFAKDGIKVVWTFFPGAGPALNEALANKKVDIGAGHGDLPTTISWATGLKTKVVLSTGRFSPVYFAIPANSNAKTLADLKGKTIATFKGTAGQLTLGRLLRKNGLTEKDFRVISQDTYSSQTALSTGDIAGSIVNPWSLVSRGVAKVIIQERDDPLLSTPGTFWVTNEFEQKYPQIVQRVVTALVKEAYWASQESNREAQYKLWSRSGNAYIDYKKDWDGFQLKTRINPLLDQYYYGAFNRAIGQSKEYKLIRRDVTLNDKVEGKYLNHALKELGLENYWPQYNAQGKQIPGTGTQTKPTKAW